VTQRGAVGAPPVIRLTRRPALASFAVRCVGDGSAVTPEPPSAAPAAVRGLVVGCQSRRSAANKVDLVWPWAEPAFIAASPEAHLVGRRTRLREETYNAHMQSRSGTRLGRLGQRRRGLTLPTLQSVARARRVFANELRGIHAKALETVGKPRSCTTKTASWTWIAQGIYISS